MVTPDTTTDPQERNTPVESSEAPAKRPRSFRTLPAAILAFGLGAALLYLGVPRAIEAVWTYSAGRTLLDIQSQQEVSDEDIRNLIADLQDTMFLVESGRKWTDLGLAQLLLSARTEAGPQARELLVQSRDSIKKGLGLALANSFAWTRLAYVESLIGGPSAQVADYLELAILTAPYEPRSQFLRLQLVFLAWPYFQEKDRNLVLQQALYVWRQAPRLFVDLALEAAQADLAREALARDPDGLERFEKMLEEKPS